MLDKSLLRLCPIRQDTPSRSLVRGKPNRQKIALTVLSDKVRELL